MTDIKLTAPRVRVVRDSEPDKEMWVQTTNADLVQWDFTRAKHKWPKFDEAPFLWLTFISWAGARRSGLIPLDVTWETWQADVLAADAGDDDTTDETGAPFPQGLTSSARGGDSASDEHGT